jgi:hypothetical protein
MMDPPKYSTVEAKEKGGPEQYAQFQLLGSGVLLAREFERESSIDYQVLILGFGRW